LPATVIFDTNFLLVPIRFGVDVFAEAERVLNQLVDPAVTPGVLRELEQLRQGAAPGFERELDFGHDLLEGETVDDSLVRLASAGGYVVATTDSELKKKLRRSGVKVLILRQRRYLQLVG
jgi:rRNA-processing protein FCF1